MKGPFDGTSGVTVGTPPAFTGAYRFWATAWDVGPLPHGFAQPQPVRHLGRREHLARPPPRRRQDRLHRLGRVLVAVLGDDRLAARERERRRRRRRRSGARRLTRCISTRDARARSTRRGDRRRRGRTRRRGVRLRCARTLRLNCAVTPSRSSYARASARRVARAVGAEQQQARRGRRASPSAARKTRASHGSKLPIVEPGEEHERAARLVLRGVGSSNGRV